MRLLKFLWWTCVTLICGVLLSFSGAYLYLSPSLPSVEALRNVQLQIPLKVYSKDGKLISEFGEMRRTPIRFADIPQDFIHALLSAEDDNFANHYGVDVKSLMRAAAQLLKSGHIQTGGSTITMQVAKNYFLTNERSFSRKINEILLALQIERQLTKDEILELYVNKIYLGNRAYGIEAAAQVYYGKPIKDLSLAEMAMIAGLPKAPSRYNPLVNPTRSTERRNWILERMLKLGFIDQQRYQAAVEEPINASYHVQTPELNAPYIAEMARAEMVRPFLSNNSMGPMPRQPADVAQAGDQIRVQRQEDGTLRFVQIPAAQSALISLDPKDGAIRSLVGGFSFEQSNYNRAIQAKRQPGSSFKPFIYSAALDNGFTAASLVNDAPIVFVDEYLDKVWRPKNDTNTFLGPIPLREALYKSRNMVSIRVLQGLGIERAISYITKFGFQRDELPRNFSLALGTATVTPMEIAGAWSVFANGGYKVNPYVIERIESRDGQVLYQANPPRVPVEEQVAAPDAEDAGNPGDPEHPEIAEGEGSIEAQQVAAKAQTTFEPTPAERIIDARTAYIMTSMLQDVIKRGTGRRALALKRTDLAGKTGTTNDSKDGWFSGYNSDYVTSVWVGFDQPETLGRREYGGTVALPIWIRYMGFALKDKPMHTMAEPPGIVSLRIDPVTGRSAAPGTPGAYFEMFKNEDTPPSVNELPPGSFPGSPLPDDEGAPIDLF